MNGVSLDTILISLESGARPKGGVSADSGEIPSLGGEHVDPGGGFDFTNIKRIPRSFFEAMRGGRICQGDILVVKDGATTGKTSFVRDDFPFPEAAVNEHVFDVRVAPDKAWPAYVFHFLFSLSGQKAIQLDFRGSTVGGISRDFAAKVVLPLPALPEQRRIAELLDRADELRAKRRATLAQLDGLVQAIFLDLFGDPITNPKGLNVSKMGDVCDVRDGTHASPMYVSDGGYPLVTSKNLSSGRLDLTDVNYISEADYVQINKRSKVDRGDIIMPMIGTIGSPVLVDQEPRFAIKNVALIKFTETSPSAIFVRQLLSGYYFDYIVSRKNRGGTQKFISLGDLRDIPLPLASVELQYEFTRRVSAIEKLRSSYLASLAELDALFAFLQHRAFRGEL